MKKWLIAVILMLSLFIPTISSAELSGVGTEIWDNKSEDFWFAQKCDETVNKEVYSGSIGLYADTFTNKTDKNLHILETKVFTTGNYIKYNRSQMCYSNNDCEVGFTIFNPNLIDSNDDVVVHPGKTVLHMTTAEQIKGATFVDVPKGRAFTTSFMYGGISFGYANYRLEGHPVSKATELPQWDAEFRTITLYSHDEKFSTSNDNYAIVECQRTLIRRCGDGILDTTREECDPKAGEWDSQTCDPVTCKKLPVCNSDYNGRDLVNLVESPNLCNVGTVKNFKYDETTRTWTWECEAAGTGKQCSAVKIYNGTWDVEKTLISESKYVTQTGQELVWEIKVTATGGDVKDMQIKDYLPKVLEYKSYTSNLPSGVTMEDNQPTTTGHDSTGDYLQWSTKGTLKENDSIILKVTTTVKTMPNSGDNYKNVACASPKGEKDKCDPEPVKTEGYPHIQKTLIGTIGKKLYVENTGEILTWEVKVTASGGDVKDFEIWDIMPNKLSFVSAELTGETYGIQITKKDKTTASGDYHTVHYWDAKGILSGGNSIKMLVKTKVETMPASGENLRNVACVVKNNKTLDCNDDKLTSPKLRIKKYFLNPDGTITKEKKTVKVDDKIVYKIIFGNSGDAVATITSIKDFLPKNVSYISSEIFINGKKIDKTAGSSTQSGDMDLDVYKGYKVVDGVYINIYGGISLNPGDEGYIILTGKVLQENKDNTTNFACIYLDGKKIDCDDVLHNFETVSCIPTLEKSSFSEVCSSETSSFGTTVTCKSTSSADIEILCDGVVVKTGHTSQLTGACSATTNDEDHKVQCKIDGRLTGTDGEPCEASFRRNTKSCGGGSSCFVAGTLVRMCNGDELEIEKVNIGDKVMAEDNKCNVVKGFDRPKLENRYLYSINGSDFFVSEEHPFKTIKDDGSFQWKAFNVELAKKEIEEARKNGLLDSDFDIEELKIGDVLVMYGNRTVTIKTFQKKKDTNNPQLYNFKLDRDNTYYANDFLVHNKGGGSGPSKDYSTSCESVEIKGNYIECSAKDNPAYFQLRCGDNIIGEYTTKKLWNYTFNAECNNATIKCKVSKDEKTWDSSTACTKTQTNPQGCFNVNAGNFSIEEGEILPFYWNLNNLDKKASGGKIRKDNYTEIKDEKYDAKHIYDEYSKPENNNCSDGQNGKIATNSMVCTFNIYDGSGYHKGVQNGEAKDNSLYTIEGPCLASSSVIENNDLIKARYGAMKETYCKDSNSTDCVFYYGDDSSSAVLPTAVYYIENFGNGAKVSVDAVNFKDTWELKGKPENKKSYGEYKIELSSVKYLVCEGGTWQKKDTSIKSSPEFDEFKPCQNDFVLTNSYTVQKTPSGNLTASMKELQKYYNYSGTMTFDKLLDAIQSTTYKPNDNVNGAMDKFINKYKKLAVNVDIKNSKLLEGGATVSKVPGKSIYFVDGSITINGSKQNIDTPFTIVQTNGNATINGNVGHNMMLLTNRNIIFQGDCTRDQTVKGIFYARGNLVRSGVNKNDKTSHDYRCTNGGLHIKGVLIGNEFNTLMNKSRSNLNMWFKAEGDEDKIKDQRRKYLMNGASVVIEYSPSIFTKSTMPPGAEDFTTALSIYKN